MRCSQSRAAKSRRSSSPPTSGENRRKEQRADYRLVGAAFGLLRTQMIALTVRAASAPSFGRDHDALAKLVRRRKQALRQPRVGFQKSMPIDQILRLRTCDANVCRKLSGRKPQIGRPRAPTRPRRVCARTPGSNQFSNRWPRKVGFHHLKPKSINDAYRGLDLKVVFGVNRLLP